MAAKTDTDVLIGGKVYTLTGNESKEYLQRVASYINGKISEYSKIESFMRQPVDTQNVLLELNIADDYFKAKQQVDILQESIDAKDKELYDVKHDLITERIKLKSMEETLQQLQDENNENQKRIVQLETELSAAREMYDDSVTTTTGSRRNRSRR
ncbi:cell division protein ZapA [Lachnospiraceae bacterium]|nr:cell division protein ZapA [Lachnospiraceae bacterium]